MCVPPSLTVCQRSGQTQESRSPSEPPLPAGPVCLRRLTPAGPGGRMDGHHGPRCARPCPRPRRHPSRARVLPASQRGPGRGAAERCAGLREGGLGGLPGSATPPPRPPPRALSVPGAEPGPEARVRVRTLAGSPLCAGTLPSGPPQPLDLSAQGTISQMRGLGCTGAG